MTPPAVVRPVSWPCFITVVVKLEKAVVRAVLGKICSRLIISGTLVNLLLIQPFIKGTAVVKHTIQDHLHSPSVDLLNQLRKQGVAGFQIFSGCRTGHIPLRLSVVRSIFIHQLSSVFDNPAKMRINVLIILAVILMVRRRYKNRVQINSLHSQALYIIQLVPDTF